MQVVGNSEMFRALVGFRERILSPCYISTAGSWFCDHWLSPRFCLHHRWLCSGSSSRSAQISRAVACPYGSCQRLQAWCSVLCNCHCSRATRAVFGVVEIVTSSTCAQNSRLAAALPSILSISAPNSGSSARRTSAKATGVSQASWRNLSLMTMGWQQCCVSAHAVVLQP